MRHAELFAAVEYSPGKKLMVQSGGKVFAADAKEAVAGSFAAQRLKLKVGDTFRPFHGLAFDPKAERARRFQGGGHSRTDERAGQPRDLAAAARSVQAVAHDPEAATDVSAVLLQLRTPMAGLPNGHVVQQTGRFADLAYPVGAIVAELSGKIAPGSTRCWRWWPIWSRSSRRLGVGQYLRP